MAEKLRAHILVSGRVQGVFFRNSTRKKAQALGVTGWVRNRPDGQVEAVFEGEEEKVRELVDWAREGPAWAKVDKLNISWENYRGEFEGFEIK